MIRHRFTEKSPFIVVKETTLYRKKGISKSWEGRLIRRGIFADLEPVCWTSRTKTKWSAQERYRTIRRAQKVKKIRYLFRSLWIWEISYFLTFHFNLTPEFDQVHLYFEFFFLKSVTKYLDKDTTDVYSVSVHYFLQSKIK